MYIRGHTTEVSIDNLEHPSVVAASLIQMLSWKERKAQKITTAEAHVMNEVFLRLLP